MKDTSASDRAKNQPRGQPGNQGQFVARGQPVDPLLGSLTPSPTHYLADNPQLFSEVVAQISIATGLLDVQVAHDYWLVRSLKGISRLVPPDGGIRKGRSPQQIKKGARAEDMPTVAKWAFCGGTALSAAWEISPRFSQDLDGSLFPEAAATKSSLRRACQLITAAAAQETGGVPKTRRTGNITKTRVELAETPNIYVDTVIEQPDEQGLVVPSRAIRSLIARFGRDSTLVDRFPELGGFRLPVVTPAYTAVNNLDALHRRAATNDTRGLELRFRDVFDLYYIAHSEHASSVRERIPELWTRMHTGGGPAVPRPSAGYGSSPAFMRGAEAYGALRRGYEMGIVGLSFGKTPSFEDAVEAAVSLDLA